MKICFTPDGLGRRFVSDTYQPLSGEYLFDHEPTDAEIAAAFPARAAALLIEYAATARRAKETGGIVLGGATIATDRDSQAMIGNAYNMAVNSSAFTTRWKNPDGSFTTMSAAQIIAIAVAVGNHVAACFSKEADVVAGVKANTITTTGAIDAAFATVTI